MMAVPNLDNKLSRLLRSTGQLLSFPDWVVFGPQKFGGGVDKLNVIKVARQNNVRNSNLN
jgi:hypothetical protein